MEDINAGGVQWVEALGVGRIDRAIPGLAAVEDEVALSIRHLPSALEAEVYQ